MNEELKQINLKNRGWRNNDHFDNRSTHRTHCDVHLRETTRSEKAKRIFGKV